MKTVFRLALVTAAMLVGHAVRADLVLNPDFSNDFQDWTSVNPTSYTSVGNVAGPYGPNVDVWHEGAVGYDHYEEQSINTVVGDNYSISFWLQPYEGSVSDYVALWGGNTVFDWNKTGNTITTQGTWSDYDASSSLISFSQLPAWNNIVIDVTATSTSTLLELGNRQDPGYSNWTMVDVEDLGHSSVPDGGATFALLGGAFAGLAALRRRFAK